MSLLKELVALSEAKKKVPAPVPKFKKYTDFDSWIGLNDAEETEIDGKLVGILYDGDSVIGLWYNKANMGTISYDYAKLYPEYKSDAGLYSELDPNWPYEN